MREEPDRLPPASGPRHAAERDLRLILWIQALRAFLYGFGSVLIGATLAAGGLTPGQVGLVFTAILAGMALASIGVGVIGERVGRRRAYVGLLLVMGVAGAVFALTNSLPFLLIAALTGTLSTDPNESGPITSLEQAMIGQADPETRTKVFGRYNAVAYLSGSIGSLAASGVAAFADLLPKLPPDQRWLLVFPIVALVCSRLAAALSTTVESHPVGAAGAERARPVPLARSRGTVTKLASLFALDSFAGGFVVQTFLVFWFQRTFGASTTLMGVVFFAAGLLQAASSIAAASLGKRFGLLNTMVFTHLPSNVLLLAVPFMPTLALAILVLLARFALSQMDVPTRQAYVVAMVDPHERTAAAAFTNTARYVSRPVGPVVAGALMQNVALAAPFVVAGAAKIVYDVALYGTFRKVKLPETATPRPSA